MKGSLPGGVARFLERLLGRNDPTRSRPQGRSHRCSGWPVLALVYLAWTPLVTHPVKDAATEEMLRAVAQEHDRAVREEAQEALDFIAGQAVTNFVVALPVVSTAEWSDAEVVAQLQAAEIRVQEAAVRAVGGRGLTNAVPALTALLDDEDERLRGAVCRALAMLRAGAPAVARRLTVEPSARVRRAAVAALVAAHDAATLRLVKELLGHARWQTREAAAEAMAAWGDRTLAPLLVPLLADEHPAVQLAAARGLAELRHPATEAALLERLAAASDEVKVGIMEALGALASRAAAPALVAFVKGTNDVLGVAAAKALRSIEHEAIVPAFREIIFKVSYLQMQTRVEALRQLRERGEAGLADRMVQFVTDPVVPPPPMGLGPTHDSVEARMEALRYLRQYGQAEHGARLRERLRETVPAGMRPLLAETLTKLTGRRYRPVPDQDYRRYFVESLGPPPWPPTPVPGVELEEPPGQPRREEQQRDAAAADQQRQQSR